MYKSMKGKLMAGILTLTTVMSLVVPTFANDIKKQERADSTIVSIDLTESLTMTQEGIVYDYEMIEEQINYHWQIYHDTERDNLISSVPDLDIQIIDNYMDTVKATNDEFLANFQVFRQKYLDIGYLDPYTYSELLVAVQSYNEKRYQQVADFINTHAESMDQMVIDYILNTIHTMTSGAGLMGYLDFGYGIYNEEENQKAKIAAAYDEIYQQVSEIESDPEEIKKMVADILKDSVKAWVKEMDIDYFTGFQAQVTLYLQNAKECGLVWNLDNNYITDVSEAVNSRELTLMDLAGGGFGAIHADMLSANLDASGTAFVSPEDVYNSSYIQQLVESIDNCFEDTGEENYYEKENVIDRVWNAMGTEYMYMSMPGASMQPVTMFYPNLMYYAKAHYQNTGKMPTFTSWFENGDSMPIYDQYRRENYVKVPSVQLTEESTKEVTRTIHYVFEDGTKAAEDVVQTVEFTVVKGLISGKVTATPDTQTFEAVANPSATHPDANVTVLDPETSAEALNIDSSAENSEITIIYPLEVKETETQTETQVETESETQTEIQVETESETQTETQVETESETQTATQIETESEQESQSNQETKDQTGSNTDAPKTGDESMTALFLILLAISAVGTVTLVYVKRKNMKV